MWNVGKVKEETTPNSKAIESEETDGADIVLITIGGRANGESEDFKPVHQV